jgi:hypothetical protein
MLYVWGFELLTFTLRNQVLTIGLPFQKLETLFDYFIFDVDIVTFIRELQYFCIKYWSRRLYHVPSIYLDNM